MIATAGAEVAPKIRAVSARPSSSVKILCVDDRAENLFALEETLTEMDLEIVKARSGLEALRHLLREDFALILMDVKMPSPDGLETAELIRQRERCQQTPIRWWRWIRRIR